jgi:hypothetical protein
MNMNNLLGKTIVKITHSVDKYVGDRLIFWTLDGIRYEMFHEQDYSENVYLEDINGDLDDLLYKPLLQAEESTNSADKMGREIYESFTWSFYKFATIKGYVTLRWLGESNGYYSESVEITSRKDPEEMIKIRNEKLKELGI